jgi:hypothetical protein
VSSKTFKPLKASNGNVTGGVLGAKMVSSVPSVKPLISLDFETSVFKKEKVSLAGHDEVRTFFFDLLSNVDFECSWNLMFFELFKKDRIFFFVLFFFFWSYMLYYAVMVIDSDVLWLCVVHC